MTDIRPFHGLRYSPSAVPDLARVLCPPYDVISPHEQHDLYRRSPFNAVRLEYGEARPSDSVSDNRYTRAAATLNDWLRRGVLTREPFAAYYWYEQGFKHDGRWLTRHALLARVRLHNWDEHAVLPHEETLDSPKEDRLQLLRATRVNISPVLALCRGRLPLGDTHTAGGDAVADAVGPDGQRHRLRVLPPDVANGIAASLRGRAIYVIDGHHRYETALAYREERRAQASRWTGDEPENFVLMAIVSLEDPGLVVLPTHRLLRVKAPSDFLAGLRETFHLEDVPGDWEKMRLALATRGQGAIAIGVATADQRVVAWVDAADAARLMPPDTPPSWRSLDTAVLRELVLRRLLGVDEQKAASEQTLGFTHDGAEALRVVRSGEYAFAFLLLPTSAERVLEVADAGERMPQKTTYFYPKIPAGLVMNPLF